MQLSAEREAPRLSLSRGLILDALLVAVLVWTAPAALRRLVETGNPYLLSREFFDDLLARFSGVGRMRFIFQPLAAVVLGLRDGRRRAARGRLPLPAAFAGRKQQPWREAIASTRDLVAVAILLDIVSQALLFGDVHPGAALVLGPVLIAVPYAISCALASHAARQGASHA